MLSSITPFLTTKQDHWKVGRAANFFCFLVYSLFSSYLLFLPFSLTDIHLADVDGDGVEELVVSSHEGGDGGSLFAYELPPNFNPRMPDDMSMNTSWERITLGGSFVVKAAGPNEAAPGFVYPFYLHGDKRPTWIIAGDGSFGVHALYPLEDFNGNPYAYSSSKIIEVGGTVGTLAVEDLNGDGTLELVVPDYDNGFIYFYSLLM